MSGVELYARLKDQRWTPTLRHKIGALSEFLQPWQPRTRYEFLRQDVASRSTESDHTLAFLEQQLPDARFQRINASRRLRGNPRRLEYR